jgi:DNA-binding response OmpR family regulator
MLLDVNLPDGDGFSFLKELRGYHDKTPAIFITSASGAKDVKRGFEIGCDDYLKKPFDFEELEARIWHVKKIYSIDENRPIELGGGVFFDPSGLCVTVDGQSVKLRPMEAKLLSYFVANQDRFISYEEIFRSLWSFDDTPDEATVRYYVKNLRKALGRDFIQSQRGVGYRFERI